MEIAAEMVFCDSPIMQNYKKIYITGLPCSGKTTLAKKLSSLLGIKAYCFDDIKFEKKFDIERKKSNQEKIINYILNKKQWIIEGGYIKDARLFCEKSDLTIFLDMPEIVLYKRALFRKILKKFKGKKFFGNDIIIIKRIYNYFHNKKNFITPKEYIQLIKNYAKNYQIINDNKALKRLINKIDMENTNHFK